ncbi:hypothetical protein V1478_000649, partial [Vespula squamosa]
MSESRMDPRPCGNVPIEAAKEEEEDDEEEEEEEEEEERQGRPFVVASSGSNCKRATETIQRLVKALLYEHFRAQRTIVGSNKKSKNVQPRSPSRIPKYYDILIWVPNWSTNVPTIKAHRGRYSQ